MIVREDYLTTGIIIRHTHPVESVISHENSVTICLGADPDGTHRDLCFTNDEVVVLHRLLILHRPDLMKGT